VHSNFQTFRFALIITLTCSLLLAAAATFLKPRQTENRNLDIKKNILKSAGITTQDAELNRNEIQELYSSNINESVINLNGEPVEGKTPQEVDFDKEKDLLPMYQWKKGDEVLAYIIPIQGKGLWSTLYGYFAVEADGETVKGITFYQHGETPGLGGEVDKKWFTDNFIGKKIFNPEGKLVSIEIVSGKVKDKISNENEYYHYVDGISGATLTGRGINKFLKTDLKIYEPFFRKIRSEQKGEANG